MDHEPLRIAVLTVSDRAAAGVYVDRGGPSVKVYVETHLAAGVAETAVVPDEREQIAAQLKRWADRGDLDIVLTTGGTGVAPRDVTPEATLDVIEKDVPGLAEAMRAASREVTPYAMLSRGIAGIRGRTLIINLPGNPKAVKENLDAIVMVLTHAVDLLQDAAAGQDHHFHKAKP